MEYSQTQSAGGIQSETQPACEIQSETQLACGIQSEPIVEVVGFAIFSTIVLSLHPLKVKVQGF